MRSLKQLISKINQSSSAILKELNSKDLSFEVITEELNQREKLVKELGKYDEDQPASSFEAAELDSIKAQFNAFSKLNLSIQAKAQNLLTLQQNKLSSAKKTRQAEDHYRVSQNPNISYF
ncbi:MAG: hypothetical protein WD357_09205 [Gracilimonas sp.]